MCNTVVWSRYCHDCTETNIHSLPLTLIGSADNNNLIKGITSHYIGATSDFLRRDMAICLRPKTLTLYSLTPAPPFHVTVHKLDTTNFIQPWALNTVP